MEDNNPPSKGFYGEWNEKLNMNVSGMDSGTIGT